MHHSEQFNTNGTIWHHSVPLGTIRHFVPFGTIPYHLAGFRTIWQHLVPFDTTWQVYDLSAPFGTILYHSVPIRYNSAPLGTIWFYLDFYLAINLIRM